MTTLLDSPHAVLMDPDLESVHRLRAGDVSVFEVVMRRHNQRLFRVARAVVRNRADAEDVVQETYVRALARLGDFSGRATFGAWLTRIAINGALDRVRRRRREARVGPVEFAFSQEFGIPSPEDALNSANLLGTIERTIDRLPAKQRVVLVMRDIQGMSALEVSEALGVSEEVVRVRLHRARESLQLKLCADENVYSFAGHDCDRIVAAVNQRLGKRLSGASTEHGVDIASGPRA